MKRLNRQRSLAGHTLVEVVVAGAIAALMIGAVGMITVRAGAAYNANLAGAATDVNAQRAIERVASEFMDADRSTVALVPTPPQPSSSIEFARAQGYAAGALLVGESRRIRFEYAPGELDNGIDDNGDGLADEGRIVLYPDLVGTPNLAVVLVEHVREYLAGESPGGGDENGNGLVDERGFTLTYDATTATLTLRVTIERRAPDGALVTRTARTSIWIRND